MTEVKRIIKQEGGVQKGRDYLDSSGGLAGSRSAEGAGLFGFIGAGLFGFILRRGEKVCKSSRKVTVVRSPSAQKNELCTLNRGTKYSTFHTI